MIKNVELQLTNDYIFKRLFSKKGNEDILKDLLESILEITIEKVEVMQEIELERVDIKDKLGILDIRAIINENITVDIEMQMVDEKNMIERTLFYWAGLYYTGLKRGQDYKLNNKVITINILMYNIFKKENYHTIATIRDNENNPYNSRNKIYAVVKIKTDTQDEFDKAWNSLGMYDEKDCNIYSLIMNMHGTPTEIFSDVGSSPMRMSIQDVEKLKTKPVQRLVLLQCSVGKIEKAGNNIASAFARSVTGKVLAGDGVVNQNEVKLNEKENNTGDDFCKENQNIFVRYYVDDEGWYIYKHDWNERVVKYAYAAPNGKMYRLYQLINMLDI